MTSGKTIFRYSRWIHKYMGLIGLFVFAYFILMGVSGILLNHRSLISHVSVPVKLLPSHYTYRDWNRMTMQDVVFSGSDPGTVYVGGKEGVWCSRDGGGHFTVMDRGFPSWAYLKDTNCLLLVEENDSRRLFAGTRSGLYVCDTREAVWRPVERKGLQNENIVDLLRVEDRMFAFTGSECFAANINAMPPDFQPHALAPPEDYTSTISMFLFLLKLHDGSLIGLPGRLFIDIVGLVLVFLCVSAIYIWYVPWQRRTFPSRQKQKKSLFFKFFYKYHFKIGIYSAFFITVIALTGMLIWKPLYLYIMRYPVPASFYVASQSANPWEQRINKALYLSSEKKLLLSTRDGFFEGPLEGPGQFERLSLKLPVRHATVLKQLENNRVLIGSFTNGSYVWDRTTHHVIDLDREKKDRMVTAVVVKNGRPLFWSGYNCGMVALENTASLSLSMPDAMIENGRVSLWSFLLGFHNGRLFQNIVPRYWVIVQTGGFLLLLVTLSGTYDWLYHKGFFRGKGETA
jgi:hypothetical protein